MPQHIPLPPPIAVGSRRVRQAFGTSNPPSSRNEHGRALQKEFEAVVKREPDGAFCETGINPRRVFKVKANTRLSDTDLQNKGLELLSETEDWGYYVLPSDVEGDTFEEAIESYISSETGRTFFDAVEGLYPYTSDDRRGPGLRVGDSSLSFPVVLDIHLWPAGDSREARERLDQVRAVVGSAELGADEQPGFLLIRCRLTFKALESALQLPAIRLVRLPPSPFLSPTDWVDVTVAEVERPAPRSGCVGIIDDGVISGHALLADLVDSFEVPAGRTWAPPSQHGTMVAGLAAYGDFESALRDGRELPAPLRVIAARVVEPIDASGQAKYPTDIPEHRVLDEAVRELARRGARVINISISDRDNYSGPHLDERTERLDTLARELDLVIVMCAGNVVDLPPASEIHSVHPKHLLSEQCRIAEPAIGVNLLTVGSIARSEQGSSSDGSSKPETRAVAAVDEISPFSRTGPGFHANGAVKPDLTHYGGNMTTQAMLSDRVRLSNDKGTGVISLAVPGPFGTGVGTSYSAPRVARIAAVVRSEYEDASANLTRALVGLSASPPEPHQIGSNTGAEAANNALRMVGFGMPDEARAIECGLSRAVMIFDGDIEVDTSVIHPIPVPEEFCQGRADRSICVAMAFDPPTRRFRREYLAARMKVDLYRATDIYELEEIVAKQKKNSKQSLWTDRRRVQGRLRPSSGAVGRSTLQVRRWHAAGARSLDPDDGPFYFLVVTHTMEPWADRADPDYDRQAYALAVELEDRSRVELDVFNYVRAQLGINVRPQVRGQATFDLGDFG